jgi:hypothetical protein
LEGPSGADERLDGAADAALAGGSTTMPPLAPARRFTMPAAADDGSEPATSSADAALPVRGLDGLLLPSS